MHVNGSPRTAWFNVYDDGTFDGPFFIKDVANSSAWTSPVRRLSCVQASTVVGMERMNIHAPVA